MISLKKSSQQGFTIIELLIVIVVIAILSIIVINTYSGIQAKARNNQRESNLQSIQEQVEVFYASNGYYPNLNDLNSASWRASNLKGLVQSKLVDPSSNCNPSTTGCLIGTPLKSGEKPYAFSYVATESDGSTSCNGPLNSGDDENCAQYKLYTNFEGVFNGISQEVLQNLD
jgi:prepilin-type N-terminal cleavage/methylation domain-containing protein